MVVIKPPPDTLGSRQRALNTRVNEAASKYIPFEIVKSEPESSEVDKLYKIDIAAKYKHVDFILEVLKSGDSLYTSRALKKCQWLYEDEYSFIMNPEYLQQSIFPFTSKKMKGKIIKTAAAHVTKPERAVKFFHYCLKEKMKNTALTFFLYTDENFKLDQLQNNKEPLFKKLEEKDMLYFRLLVGKSFILLDALLSFISINWKITKTARQFKFLFSESEEKYLDIAEKYVSTYYGFQTDKFDLKLSDAIMKKHKHRVLGKPKFYVNTVNIDILVRNSTIDDVKIYAKALLPENVKQFWALHHYYIFKPVFQIIPHDETYMFFKNYFAEHYPDGEFEMHPDFYKQNYHMFMTFEQREEWAYQHIKSEKQILGVGKDYLWYRFINFAAAFEEIKRYISVTKDADKRNDMLRVLIESARNDRELETLFKYFNKRHVNELRKHKEAFLKKVLSQHNVFEFDDECWTAFYPIMLSMDLEDKNSWNVNYETIALLYHILHQKEMSDRLTKFLHERFNVDFVGEHLNNIKDSIKQQMLHEYFFTFYMRIITESKNKRFEFNEFNNDVEPSWQRYFKNIDSSMQMFNEDGEERMAQQKKPNPERKKRRPICINEISGRALIHDLKKDKDIVIGKLQRAQREFESFPIKINTFLKKIKIYFPDDVRNIYLHMFQEIILNDSLVNENVHRQPSHVVNAVRTGVNAIFQMADEDVKLDFMKKYRPRDTMAEQRALESQHVRIQRAVCRYACLSRPPVPLSLMLTYMKGEFVKQCLHVFNTYLALLPLPMCQEFVRLVIDAPVSIQKHSIRLAFHCYTPVSLKEAMMHIWTHTKNVSLRRIIYKSIFSKVVDTKDKDFFEVLKVLTLDLRVDDEDEIFTMTVSKTNELPEDFIGDYIDAVWTAVNKFKDMEPNITRKSNVITYMCDHIQLLDEEFVSKVVNEHIDDMVHNDKFELAYSKEDIAPLYKKKWNLIAHYIIHYPCSDYPPQKYVKLAQYLVKKSTENWDKMAHGIFVYQERCWDFFNNLKEISLQQDYAEFEYAIPVFEGILQIVNRDLELYDSYMLTLELKLILIAANVIKSDRKNYVNGKELEAVIESVKHYGEAVGRLVSECVESEMYFISFSSAIKEKIENYFEEIIQIIYAEIGDDGYEWKWKELLNTALMHLVAALIEFKLCATYELAVQLMPSDCKECSSDMFKGLIKKFQEFPNAEVQLTLYDSLQKYCDRKYSPKKAESCHIN